MKIIYSLIQYNKLISANIEGALVARELSAAGARALYARQPQLLADDAPGQGGGGARGVSATLWTDDALRPQAMSAADDRISGMNDHRRMKVMIEGSFNALRPHLASAIHADARARFEAQRDVGCGERPSTAA